MPEDDEDDRVVDSVRSARFRELFDRLGYVLLKQGRSSQETKGRAMADFLRAAGNGLSRGEFKKAWSGESHLSGKWEDGIVRLTGAPLDAVRAWRSGELPVDALLTPVEDPLLAELAAFTWRPATPPDVRRRIALELAAERQKSTAARSAEDARARIAAKEREHSGRTKMAIRAVEDEPARKPRRS